GHGNRRRRSAPAPSPCARSGPAERPAAAEAVELILGNLVAEVLFGHLGGAAAPAHFVLRGDHLLDVLFLEPGLVLVGARRLPIYQVGPAARVEVADEDEYANQERDHRDRAEDEPHATRIRFAAMPEAFIVDAVRTPMGGYRGSLSGVRPDDLAARVIAAVVERNGIDP